MSRWIVLCLGFCLILTACGGSGDESKPTTVFVPTATGPTATFSPLPPTWTPQFTPTPLPVQPTFTVPRRATATLPVLDVGTAAVTDEPAVVDAPAGWEPPAAVTDATFKAEVLESNLPVLVEFWADWCDPCVEMAPIIEQVSADYFGRLKVVKLDAETNQATVDQYGIGEIPLVLMFREGNAVGWLKGLTTLEKLRAWIDGALVE